MARPEGAVETLCSAALRATWGVRAELAVAGGLWVMWHLATKALGPLAGKLVMATAIGVVVAVPWSRRWLWRTLRFARVRRRFKAAVRLARMDKAAGRVPRVVRVRDSAAGYVLSVRVPPGLAVVDLEKVTEPVAAAMAVRDIRVRRDPANAAAAQVSVIRRDPLADPAPLAWPLSDTARVCLWDPVPVGVDEDGNRVEMALPGHNVLLGGEPGAGKSAALSLLLAAAALDPAVSLWLLDGKQVELAPWARCAQASVGPNVAEATEVLHGLQTEMDLRYAQLLAWGRRKVTPGDGLGLHVVACDELALYLAAGDRKERTECAEVLRDLVARGRAAGLIVVAATQKPASDIVPTSLRDLFGFVCHER